MQKAFEAKEFNGQQQWQQRLVIAFFRWTAKPRNCWSSQQLDSQLKHSALQLHLLVFWKSNTQFPILKKKKTGTACPFPDQYTRAGDQGRWPGLVTKAGDQGRWPGPVTRAGYQGWWPGPCYEKQSFKITTTVQVSSTILCEMFFGNSDASQNDNYLCGLKSQHHADSRPIFRLDWLWNVRHFTMRAFYNVITKQISGPRVCSYWDMYDRRSFTVLLFRW